MRLLFILSLIFLLAEVRANDIEDGDGSAGKVGDPCREDNECAEGLDCVRAPVRKKCIPMNCAVEAATTAMLKENFDLGAYGQDMMQQAGITARSKMFRPFPSKEHLDILDTSTTDMAIFMETVRRNPPPLALIGKTFENCTKNTVDGTTLYYGASWELGALATYNGDVFWAQGSNDTEQLATLNNCFGFVLGYDAGVSGLLGIALTGTAADLQSGCKQMFPIVEFPPFALQIGFIDCSNPTWVIELTAGLSAGVGLPGYTSCTTTAL